MRHLHMGIRQMGIGAQAMVPHVCQQSDAPSRIKRRWHIGACITRSRYSRACFLFILFWFFLFLLNHMPDEVSTPPADIVTGSGPPVAGRVETQGEQGKLTRVNQLRLA